MSHWFSSIWSLCAGGADGVEWWCTYHLPTGLPFTEIILSFFAAIFLAYTSYYFFWLVSKPIVRLSENSPLNDIIKTLPELHKSYWPTFWLANGVRHSVFLVYVLDTWCFYLLPCLIYCSVCVFHFDTDLCHQGLSHHCPPD